MAQLCSEIADFTGCHSMVRSTLMADWAHGPKAYDCAVLISYSIFAVQHLTDLDDDCLLNVFTFLSPLPDLISLSKACRVSVQSSYVHFVFGYLSADTYTLTRLKEKRLEQAQT